MKIIVVSDSHGNIVNLKHVLGFAKRINAGAIIHCGDWDNVGAVETALDSGLDIYGVLGNADIREDVAESLKLKAKGFDKTYLETELGGKKTGIVHNIKHLAFSIKHLDILFCGHTQRQEKSTLDGVKIVNPGALENEIEFAVYDTRTNKVNMIRI